MKYSIRKTLNQIRKKRLIRLDEENWKTIRGTHVLIDGSTGEIKYGPERLRAWGKSKSSAKAKTEATVKTKAKSYAETKARCDEIRNRIQKEKENDKFLHNFYLWHSKYKTAIDGIDWCKRKLAECEEKRDEIKDYDTRKKMLEESLSEDEAKLKELEKKCPKIYKEYEEAARERDEAILREFPTVDDCKTSEDVTDYLRAKEYFRKNTDTAFDSDGRVDLQQMGIEYAKGVVKTIERFMTDYPKLVGKFDGIDCCKFEQGDANAYAYAKGSAVSINVNYFGEGKTGAEDYEDDVDGEFHPYGTEWTAIVDHEFTHAVEKILERKLNKEDKIANIVMKRAMERVDGKYVREEEYFVRKSVSRYATMNAGIRQTYINGQMQEVENESYGRNTEYLAEAMAEARNSDIASNYSLAAKEELEELMKEADLL